MVKKTESQLLPNAFKTCPELFISRNVGYVELVSTYRLCDEGADICRKSLLSTFSKCFSSENRLRNRRQRFLQAIGILSLRYAGCELIGFHCGFCDGSLNCNYI